MVDDKPVDGPFAHWLVTPVTQFEPTFEILPHGDIGNDSLYLVAVNAKYDTELLDIMRDVYDDGRHFGDEKVTYMQIRNKNKTRSRFEKQFCIDDSVVISKWSVK